MFVGRCINIGCGREVSVKVTDYVKALDGFGIKVLKKVLKKIKKVVDNIGKE